MKYRVMLLCCMLLPCFPNLWFVCCSPNCPGANANCLSQGGDTPLDLLLGEGLLCFSLLLLGCCVYFFLLLLHALRCVSVCARFQLPFPLRALWTPERCVSWLCCFTLMQTPHYTTPSVLSRCCSVQCPKRLSNCRAQKPQSRKCDVGVLCLCSLP